MIIFLSNFYILHSELLFRHSGSNPSLAKVVSITGENCTLDIFKPVRTSTKTYSKSDKITGTYSRVKILASNIPVVESDENDASLLTIDATPKAILKELGIDWQQTKHS